MSYHTTDYLKTLRTHLQATTPLKGAELEKLLNEHHDLITELTTTGADLAAELGSPNEYAAATAEEFSPGEPGPDSSKQPQGTFLGMPYDFRGLGNREVRSRIWDPQDPRILQPRLFGLGWTINLGALAVKLGWIRPDDIDADVLAAIPSFAMTTAKAVPAVLATGTALTLAAGWRELPDTVSLNYRLGGEPRGRQYAKNSIVVMPVLGVGLAVLPFLPMIAKDREDALRVSSISSLVGAAALGTTASVVAEARGIQRPGLFATAALKVGLLSAAGVLIVPFRAGLNRVWHREGVK